MSDSLGVYIHPLWKVPPTSRKEYKKGKFDVYLCCAGSCVRVAKKVSHKKSKKVVASWAKQLRSIK